MRRLPSLLLLLLLAPAVAGADAELAHARTLLLTGRYADARGAYERLAARSPLEAAIGVARCREATGELDEATRALAAVTAKPPGAAAAEAELARLEFERGRWEAAQARVDAALQRDSDEPQA